MPKRVSPTERLGDVLANSLKRLELGKRLDEYGVWPVWNEVVGKPVARNAQPERIRNGTLFVKVSSPVWMQQLQYMKEMIAENINQRLKAEIVKNIFFVVGNVDSSTGEPEVKAVPSPPANPAESQLDEQFLESVKDPEIRQAFTKLLKKLRAAKAEELTIDFVLPSLFDEWIAIWRKSFSHELFHKKKELPQRTQRTQIENDVIHKNGVILSRRGEESRGVVAMFSISSGAMKRRSFGGPQDDTKGHRQQCRKFAQAAEIFKHSNAELSS